MAEVKLTCC